MKFVYTEFKQIVLVYIELMLSFPQVRAAGARHLDVHIIALHVSAAAALTC